MAATQNNESLADFRGRLVLVGAGKMGSAMLEGWLGRGLKPASVAVIEPQPSSELTKLAASGVSMNPAVGDVGEVSAVVLAVKPQTAQQVVSGLRPLIGAGTVLVSIMAGRTIAFLVVRDHHASYMPFHVPDGISRRQSAGFRDE